MADIGEVGMAMFVGDGIDGKYASGWKTGSTDTG